jgi:hypothetical protein
MTIGRNEEWVQIARLDEVERPRLSIHVIV